MTRNICKKWGIVVKITTKWVFCDNCCNFKVPIFDYAL